MIRVFISLMFVLLAWSVSAQDSRKVLFLGNSYTYVNDLPQTAVALAASAGDQLTVDVNAPGGYTLQGHSTNQTSLDKIKLGGWDYVVLQEQSQLPSFPDFQVESEVFPYAQDLDSVINAFNECGETMFFMTWGRKNGDASNCANWPPVCTYEGM
ncbi:MAG: SGNH/GDSL hydrolase family protein, partial [Bacteroidales bacterium]|nr:SGNH/GDSL hydrolase family protein [Bacteroidales bacterium]